jgi:Cu+-exporting ATPase
MTPTAAGSPAGLRTHVELLIGGMTCGACANRVERTLNKLDGVMAMVPALRFVSWQWASLTLAAPVVVWGALPLHRTAAACDSTRGAS